MTLRPGATIGVLGGGQLGRMLMAEAHRMGYRVHVLDPDPRCPCAPYADRFVQGAFSDEAAALRLADGCDVVTLETEHVPATVLDAVAKTALLRPAPGVLRTIQDRLVQREFLEKLGAPQPRFAPVDGPGSLRRALEATGTPAILKTRRGGYDGKGQVRIHRAEEAEAAWGALGAPAVLESFVPFEAEVSQLLARGPDGAIRAWPLTQNVHRRGILHTTQAPAGTPALAEEALALATGIVEALDHVGVAAVEMFVHEGRLLVNEIAPRTHNSGHFTLGASVTSQFEQHLRAICGLPLGETSLHRPAAMVNLLGDLWRNGPPRWEAALGADVKLHLYGKHEARPGRKMGHVLAFADSSEEALRRVEAIHQALEKG